MAIEFSALVRPKAVESGEWVDWGCGVSLMIRPAGNRDYELFVARRAMERVRAEAPKTRRRFEEESSAASVDAEQSMEDQMDATAHTILCGWRGINENGEAMPYTPEKGVELFQADFASYQQVWVEAQRIARAARKLAQDAEGNSEGS